MNCCTAPCSIGPRQMIGWSAGHQHAHRDDLDAVRLGRHDALVGVHLGARRCSRASAGCSGRRRRRRGGPRARPCAARATARLTDGRGLADAALARAHRDDVADAGDLLPAEAAAGADVGRHLRARRGDARQRGDERLRLGLHLVLDRAGGRRELDGEVDLAALDLDLLHEAEGHDVLVEVGVLHAAQGGEHLLLSSRSRVLTSYRGSVRTRAALSTTSCSSSNLVGGAAQHLGEDRARASSTNVVGIALVHAEGVARLLVAHELAVGDLVLADEVVDLLRASPSP